MRQYLNAHDQLEDAISEREMLGVTSDPANSVAAGSGLGGDERGHLQIHPHADCSSFLQSRNVQPLTTPHVERPTSLDIPPEQGYDPEVLVVGANHVTLSASRASPDRPVEHRRETCHLTGWKTFE